MLVSSHDSFLEKISDNMLSIVVANVIPIFEIGADSGSAIKEGGLLQPFFVLFRLWCNMGVIATTLRHI